MSIEATPDAPKASSLATEIAHAVLAVEGVQRLYSTGPVVASVVRTALGALTREQRRDDLITITDRDGVIEVRVCIGVASIAAAPLVCRHVFIRVDELLSTERDGRVRKIAVTVGSVEG